VAGKHVAVFDPSGRLIAELALLSEKARVPVRGFDAASPDSGAAIAIAPAAAADLGPLPANGPSRWVVGDPNNAPRIAGAAASVGAAGVLLAPVAPEALAAIAASDTTSAEVDLARARGLIATSLVDLTGSATETLRAVADGFSAADCIVWWKDGNSMTPTGAREPPADGYRSLIAAAARVAAASSGTVITPAPIARSVMAEALRSTPTEVSGLVALVDDRARRFSAAERTDLKAIAARLTRELSWLSSHRRIVAEGERLLAASLHDPLTGAMTRGAFEQTITHEVAAAGRRGEQLTLAVVDVVGLRKINLGHGHKAGDEVLAQIAGRLRATVRGNDPIGRLGGDEVAVLLVGATDDQAVLIIRKLLHRLATEPIKLDESTVLSVELRCALTEIAVGERSGEAALARCYSVLRAAPVGDVRIVASDERPAENDAHSDASSLSVGTIVGGTYRVVHELSRGAMGVVYRGEDLGLNRPVAIKVLRSDLASDKDLVSRFRAEAGLLASLHHPNLVQVYALGEHAGDVYFVMELVEGQPLSEVLRATLERKEWFPINAVIQIVLEIGDALDAMHAIGVVHRDVKPANILLDRERDRAVLVDVGVAIKAGDQRDAAGTPGFAAPESFLEQATTPTTDVYGLAATIYCLLTGRPPFGSGPAPQVVQRQLNDALVPVVQLRPNMSDAVDEVLRKALAPQPRKRWASASTFAIALGRALERLSPDLPALPRTTTFDRQAAAAIVSQTTGLSSAEQEELDRLQSQNDKPPDDAVVGRVRSAHLRVLSRILQTQLGESGTARILADHPELATALSPTLAPLSWTSLRELVAVLAQATAVLPNAALSRKVGRGTMSATFPRLFGADPASLPAETILAALPSFWPRYHEWGEINVAVQANGAQVALEGFSGSTDVCAMVAAELERIVELTGATSVVASHAACRCLGTAHRCEFRLAWTR
jgi:diguanylate cyclase (GGDEF)-like protein